MGVDVLVSSPDGTRTLAIQVKTTEWALRLRGRGEQKVPFQLQFPLGYKAAKIDSENLLFAFVDLKGLDDDSLVPDVYLVPADYVMRHCAEWVEEAKMVRLHIGIEEMEPFKNNWDSVVGRLAD
jgi:hypothetical protein